MWSLIWVVGRRLGDGLLLMDLVVHGWVFVGFKVSIVIENEL